MFSVYFGEVGHAEFFSVIYSANDNPLLIQPDSRETAHSHSDLAAPKRPPPRFLDRIRSPHPEAMAAEARIRTRSHTRTQTIPY